MFNILLFLRVPILSDVHCTYKNFNAQKSITKLPIIVKVLKKMHLKRYNTRNLIPIHCKFSNFIFWSKRKTKKPQISKFNVVKAHFFELTADISEWYYYTQIIGDSSACIIGYWFFLLESIYGTIICTVREG